MSLKSIRKSYSKLLDAFDAAGVKLTESQKGDIDAFVLAIESNMSRQRRMAIRQTRKAVESKMEKEYREVFESIMANTRRNAELASAIQDKITQVNEQKKMAAHVDGFLDLYVESVLPKKTIVDYDRMQKLERIHESLKDALVLSEDDVSEKKDALEQEYKVKKSKCETEVAKAKAELNESMKQARKLKAELDKAQAKLMLESKTKDLPSYEARKVKKQLKEATAPEIEKKFKKTLESVRKDMKSDDEDAAVNEEIDEILAKEDDILKDRPHNAHRSVKEAEETDEDDILKDRPHNAHKSVKEAEEFDEDDILKDRPHNAHVSVNEEEEEDECDDVFETIEEVEFDEDGEVELDESDQIDAA